jgi:hypothetical protein
MANEITFYNAQARKAIALHGDRCAAYAACAAVASYWLECATACGDDTGAAAAAFRDKWRSAMQIAERVHTVRVDRRAV